MREEIEAARSALSQAVDAAPQEQVEQLARARSLVDEALDEAMARAVLEGTSVRAVAAAAGLAPNSVPPRLAQTDTLAAYSSVDGRVSSEGIARARFDSQRGLEAPPPPPGAAAPLRFRRRESR